MCKEPVIEKSKIKKNKKNDLMGTYGPSSCLLIEMLDI